MQLFSILDVPFVKFLQLMYQILLENNKGVRVQVVVSVALLNECYYVKEKLFARLFILNLVLNLVLVALVLNNIDLMSELIDVTGSVLLRIVSQFFDDLLLPAKAFDRLWLLPVVFPILRDHGAKNRLVILLSFPSLNFEEFTEHVHVC